MALRIVWPVIGFCLAGSVASAAVVVPLGGGDERAPALALQIDPSGTPLQLGRTSFAPVSFGGAGWHLALPGPFAPRDPLGSFGGAGVRADLLRPFGLGGLFGLYYIASEPLAVPGEGAGPDTGPGPVAPGLGSGPDLGAPDPVAVPLVVPLPASVLLILASLAFLLVRRRV